MKHLISATAALLAVLTVPAVADPAEAETFVRAGNPVKALLALAPEDTSPAAQFWRARALIDLGRLEEASYALESVPAGHELSPYAQRALIYCAWQCPQLDFPSIIAPLTESSDLAVSRMATAALAEYELRRDDGGGMEALRDIQELAAMAPEWMLASRLLEIEGLRQQRRFDDALTLCRLLEADKSLPTLARQRVRLALSELYYAKEMHQVDEPDDEKPTPEEEDDGHENGSVEGKGEETLLQFIAANPDSPLLGEAFRRLAQHGTLKRGEYVADKLVEWMNDPAKPHRAALALRVRQLMLHRALRPGQQPDATCVNLATAQLPREAMTAQMLREQVRVLTKLGKQDEALLYRRMLPAGSAHALFYEGLASRDSLDDALDAFLGSALVADESLRPAALVNALLAAHASGNMEEASRLMAEPHPRSTRAALLAARAAYLMPRDVAAARRDLEEWISLYPADKPPVDAIMDLAVLDMDSEPQKAAEHLRLLVNRPRAGWTDAQELRYYALLIESAKRGYAASGHARAQQIALAIARKATQEGSTPGVRAYMELKVASMLAAMGRPGDALTRLERFIARHADRPELPRALLMAGHAAASIGSLPSLRRAAALYARCAEMESPYGVRAKLYRASVMLRINRRVESRNIIDAVLLKKDSLDPDDVALARSFLSDCWALEGTPEGLQKATDIVAEALADKSLPESWFFRMRMMHATLCSRAGNHEEALADYLAVLHDAPATGGAPSQSDWYTLYAAGSGAVYQYMQLKKYTEAANLAERIANWRSGSYAGARPGGPSSDHFAQWASSIRRIYPTEK